jgi:hypothetical protein
MSTRIVPRKTEPKLISHIDNRNLIYEIIKDDIVADTQLVEENFSLIVKTLFSHVFLVIVAINLRFHTREFT